ncbi:hypothetical protein J2T20_001439 [Paenibacillus wynnii]|nr:hypothetical protein [Paenibacillus wynnii]
MENTQRYFYCYDKRLRNQLMKNSQSYICSGLHQQTLNPFWQFPFTEELKRVITEYNHKKKS